MKNLLRSAVLAAAAALVLAAPPASACPSCAATSSPKEPNVWPIVGAFMLVPWALAGGAVLLIRRESRSA
jgi:ABC-type oligopeptide transport system substrate-binding subunit